MYRAIASLMFLVVISGCATTFPKDPDGQISYWLDHANKSIDKSDLFNLGQQINNVLEISGGSSRAKQFLSSNAHGLALYRKYLTQKIDGVSYFSHAEPLLVILKQVQSAKLFSDDECAAFIANLNKKVLDGNISGAIEIKLSDKLDSFPALKSPEHRKAILDRTIRHLQETQGNRNYAARSLHEYVKQQELKGNRTSTIQSLLEYVKQAGTSSADGKYVESMLPSLNIRGDEIADVAKVFPEYAKARREELFGKAVLQFKNIDRLSAEDLSQVIKQRVKGIDWVSAPDQKTTVLVVERVRNDEKVIPERTQTITYAQHQVSLMAAALLMPRNASYMYDLISGGSEIEYGYVVTALVDGKQLTEEVVRGKVGGEYQRCQNARIQNVFGGVSPADFVANDHMASTCNGRQATPIDGLRRDVLDKVADGVLNVPSIRKIHDLH